MLSIATFSLVAKDPNSHDLGVVVASKFLAVGSVVPWLEAGVGAVATQSYANTSFGVRSLEMLKSGSSLEEIAASLFSNDPEHQSRQYGVVSANGNSYTFTGSECAPWAGGRSGQNYAAQGNLLTGANVIDALVDTFLNSQAPFPERLLEALSAADMAGGDARGRQSAALYVARERGGYAGFNDRYIDLRVDDHVTPIPELQRLLGIHRLLFERPNPEALLNISGEEVAKRVLEVLRRAGQLFTSWNEAAQKALEKLAGQENLEERFTERGFIDPVALDYLEQKFGR